MPIRVLGLDPSLRCTGYGLIDCDPATGATTLIDGGVFRTPPTATLPDRLAILHADLALLLEETQPDQVAIEDLFTRAKNMRTGILMAHARGVLILACTQAGLPVTPYAPRLIKNALCGSGDAKKAQIQSRVQTIFGLATPPEPHDVADALAIALTHIYRVVLRQPVR